MQNPKAFDFLQLILDEMRMVIEIRRIELMSTSPREVGHSQRHDEA